MAGGGGGRTLEQTPTWAVAIVCFILVAISIVIEYIIHLIAKVCCSNNTNIYILMFSMCFAVRLIK